VEKVANSSSLSAVPLFLTSLIPTCGRNHSFVQHDAIFDDRRMGNVLSGALLMWEPQSLFGNLPAYLVTYEGLETSSDVNVALSLQTPTPSMPRFSSVQEKWKILQPTGVRFSEITPRLTAPECPTFRQHEWVINGSVPLLTLGQVFNEKLKQSWEKGVRNATKKSGATNEGSGLAYLVIFVTLLSISCIIL
jgi:hypothetical protein